MTIEIFPFASHSAAKFTCPVCGAKAGKPCRSKRGGRVVVRGSPHKSRGQE